LSETILDYLGVISLHHQINIIKVKGSNLFGVISISYSSDEVPLLVCYFRTNDDGLELAGLYNIMEQKITTYSTIYTLVRYDEKKYNAWKEKLERTPLLAESLKGQGCALMSATLRFLLSKKLITEDTIISLDVGGRPDKTKTIIEWLDQSKLADYYTKLGFHTEVPDYLDNYKEFIGKVREEDYAKQPKGRVKSYIKYIEEIADYYNVNTLTIPMEGVTKEVIGALNENCLKKIDPGDFKVIQSETNYRWWR